MGRATAVTQFQRFVPPEREFGIEAEPIKSRLIEMEGGTLIQILPDLPVERQSVYVVFPPGRFTQPKTRAFIDFLVSSGR
jgi:DNA-binding transcriptional LysR family regulator